MPAPSPLPVLTNATAPRKTERSGRCHELCNYGKLPLVRTGTQAGLRSTSLGSARRGDDAASSARGCDRWHEHSVEIDGPVNILDKIQSRGSMPETYSTRTRRTTLGSGNPVTVQNPGALLRCMSNGASVRAICKTRAGWSLALSERFGGRQRSFPVASGVRPSASKCHILHSRHPESLENGAISRA